MSGGEIILTYQCTAPLVMFVTRLACNLLAQFPGKWYFSPEIVCFPEDCVHAPYNDLCLYKDLIRYGSVDPEVSASAIKALQRHLWYLIAEFVPLALYSEDVPSA